MFHRIAVVCLILGIGALSPLASAQPAEKIERITAAAPDKPCAKPAKPRKLLVFNLSLGFKHEAIPLGAQMLRILGKKTGAFEAILSEDVAMFAPGKLAEFDAVCFNNTTGELFEDPVMKKALLDWVKAGRGVVGIHAATDCFYKWPEFGEMMGGYFDGHPWNETVTVKIDEPKHPINAAFEGQPFEVADEIYQFRDPYSREALRVLLSLDTAKTNMKKDGIKRTDGDFAVSWVRNYGKGRVFFCSLGHRDEVFWDPKILRHYLAGVQFALGDLPAAANPIGKPAATADDGTPLFNGKDLTGWKGLVADPKKRATMSAEEMAKAQAEADENMRAHWKVENGAILFDGKGQSLCTVKDYGDFELLVDWKIETGGDSGIYLRGSPQVQIKDYALAPEGSGGLYNNQHNPSKPLVRADKPVGEWNTFRIRMVGPRVTVHLNDVLVVDDVVLENYWDRDKPIYPTGQIELQAHGNPLAFRNISMRELPAAARPAESRLTWRELFNGKDLAGWTCKAGSWAAENGELVRKGGGDIWSEEKFGDFILQLEFKLDKETNSGVFFRTGNTADCVQTGIEMQVFDTFGKEPPGRNDCGAIYDCLAPAKNVVKKPGEWNDVTLTCKGSTIRVVMNGDAIIDMNLDRWTEAGKNPDGTPNKFKTAYKDMPRTGYIGFQDHGKPVWYRNLRIKPLAD